MLLVEPVRVGCSERPAAKPLKLGMLEHAGNNELPQPVSAVLDLDVDGAVVAGHKIPDNDDDPKAIAENPQYLRDFIRLDRATDTSRQLFDAMIELYPDRANPGSIWGGANAAKREAANGSSSAVPAALGNEQR